ncbi:MAG: penicillin-binding protein 2 [Chloroflexota bacterium]|nr:penicillin-binding protein 2 [Chloroflexota bacterium]
MIGNVRRLGGYLLIAFFIVSGGLTWWQVLDAQQLAARSDNPQVIAAHQSAQRGAIFDARGTLLASSAVIGGLSRRTYLDPAFTHLIGYASLRYGTTGLEKAYDDLLTGRADPNPLNSIVDDIMGRQPEPNDLTLTIDRRLQDFAAKQLSGLIGAVVAIDPKTGAILAMTSTPTFNATAISGDPATATAPMAAIVGNVTRPLIDRSRQGVYTPGSIMKVLTASAALDSGAITTQTTFPDQPRQETTGFKIGGFTIREHDLGNLQPALWSLSQAMQVSSNIFFAHVGLEIGADRLLDYAKRFGFCSGLAIGSGSRSLPVSASYVTRRAQGGGCSPFADDPELASAAFGQAQVAVTPFQMALVAATVANDGVRPETYVVRDVRAHTAIPAKGPSPSIVTTTSPGFEQRVISSQTAGEVRAAMVDAVQGPLGKLYAGSANVRLYGAGGVYTAGKTGTAQRSAGLAPHSWFVGFAPAQGGATPAIALAVIIEGGGAGSGRAAPIGGRVMAEWLKLLAGS